MQEHFSYNGCVTEELLKEEKSALKVMQDFEKFLLQGKEGEVYKFLMLSVEKPLIENILNKTEGNKSKAAKILGINRNTLHAKIKRLNIDIAQFKP